jgi:hypothetical protein
MQLAALPLKSTSKNYGINLPSLTKLKMLMTRAYYILNVGLSLFYFSLQGVGKDILIDKFWFVLMAF